MGVLSFIVIVVMIGLGGCAIVLGSGRAEVKVDRKLDVGVANDADAEIEIAPAKEKRPR